MIFRYPDIDPQSYLAAAPFPHIAIRDAWDQALLERCNAEIGNFSGWDGEKDFYGSRFKRYCGRFDRLPLSVQSVIAEAASPKFLAWLEHLTGENGLIPDPYLEGGGVHSIGRGGFLKIHADFNWHRKLHLYRRLNLLLYLNPDWDPGWGGALELFANLRAAPARSVDPVINQMVVFTTDDASFHGHPHELLCPPEIHRNSIALYYYSAIRPERHFAHRRLGTDYRAMANDTFKQSSWISRRWGFLRDAIVSRRG